MTGGVPVGDDGRPVPSPVTSTEWPGAATLLWPGGSSAAGSVGGAPGSAAAVPGNGSAPSAPALGGSAGGGSGAGADGCTTMAPGWAARENGRPGVHLPSVGERDGARQVLGYADRTAARCGDRVSIALSGAPQRVRLNVYRVGWYGGAGARLVWRSGSVRVTRRPQPRTGSVDVAQRPNWPASATLTVTPDWAPGLYAVLPMGPHTSTGPLIPLVITAPEQPDPLLYVTSNMTWNAYGEWGGRSLYRGPGMWRAQIARNRGHAVAVHRPLIGTGYHQFVDMDLAPVTVVEQFAATTGLDVGYTSDVLWSTNPDRWRGHAGLVFGGHSEYWTRSMYDGLDQALAAGVNVGFLGANNLWWQARLEDADGGEPQVQVVHRTMDDDPAAQRDPALATVQWASRPLGRNPAAVLGQSHAGIGVRGGLQIFDAPEWFTHGTALSRGGLLPDVVGNEADGYLAAAPNPRDDVLLAAGVLRGAGRPTVVSANWSVQPSGAGVFAAGTTHWACAPVGRCEDEAVPGGTAGAVRRMTQNVLTVLAVPQAGSTHPARTRHGVSARSLLHSLGRGAVGRYGAPEND